jgi:hypothetical protein
MFFPIFFSFFFFFNLFFIKKKHVKIPKMKKHMNNMNKKHVCFLMVGKQELPKIWKNLIFLREMFMFFSRVFIFFPVSEFASVVSYC